MKPFSVYRRVAAVLAVTALALALTAWSPAARAAASGAAAISGGAWGKAIEVPGTAVLNSKGAGLVSVSCPSAGNCGGGGSYNEASEHGQAFVVSEVKGTWRKAIEVPGTAPLNQGRFAQVLSVSCASAGNCSAGGFYTDSTFHQQAFVVSETNGTWRRAIEVPGTAVLNSKGAGLLSVSCASAGNCSAGGYYGSTQFQGMVFGGEPFVVSEVHGTWRKAIQVPGIATFYTEGNAQVLSVSCASAGNCSAGGYYTDTAGNTQAFVVSQTNGRWRNAREVPGTATLNQGGIAQVLSVSCASAGNCSAGGYYTDTAGHTQAFVVSEVHGTWHKAIEVPGTATLNQGRYAQVLSVSCASAGNCSAGGYYSDSLDSTFGQQAFVLSEVNGTWRKAIEVPGTAALNQGVQSAQVNSVSCASAGNCSAGGYYTAAAGSQQAFVVSETNGTWRKAIEVPGTATLNQGGHAQVFSVSCASARNCVAGGVYTDTRDFQAFVVSKN